MKALSAALMPTVAAVLKSLPVFNPGTKPKAPAAAASIYDVSFCIPEDIRIC